MRTLKGFTVSRQLQRQEDDVRLRMSNASDAYRKAVTETQAIRQEYFNFQLPRILRVSDPPLASPLVIKLAVLVIEGMR